MALDRQDGRRFGQYRQGKRRARLSLDPSPIRYLREYLAFAPAELGPVMPTGLGSALGAAESCPGGDERWALDAVFWWPRLCLLLPDSAPKPARRGPRIDGAVGNPAQRADHRRAVRRRRGCRRPSASARRGRAGRRHGGRRAHPGPASAEGHAAGSADRRWPAPGGTAPAGPWRPGMPGLEHDLAARPTPRTWGVHRSARQQNMP